MNYDFKRAREVFLDLTDIQRQWMSMMVKIDQIRAKDIEAKHKVEATMSKVFRRGRYV